jgi:hypothetical protein
MVLFDYVDLFLLWTLMHIGRLNFLNDLAKRTIVAGQMSIRVCCINHN